MKSKALSIVLEVIGENTGLTPSDVVYHAKNKTLYDRYKACSGCRIRACERCNLSFSKEKKH